MSLHGTPRLHYIEVDWPYQFISGHERELEETISEYRGGRLRYRQSRFALLSLDLYNIGLMHYAIGSQMSRVKRYFQASIQIYAEVLKLRGSESTGEIKIEFLDDPSEPFDIGEALAQGRSQSVDQKDYSLGTSRDTLRMVYLALGIQDNRRAKEFAEHIWDPADADYIGPDSEVCPPNDQRIAYGVRQTFENSKHSAKDELSAIINPSESAGFQAAMITAIIDADGAAFVRSVRGLLDWHNSEARRDENRENTDFIICLPALGLSAHALLANVVEIESLPHNDAHLPFDLLAGHADSGSS